MVEKERSLGAKVNKLRDTICQMRSDLVTSNEQLLPNFDELTWNAQCASKDATNLLTMLNASVLNERRVGRTENGFDQMPKETDSMNEPISRDCLHEDGPKKRTLSDILDGTALALTNGEKNKRRKVGERLCRSSHSIASNEEDVID